jgi:ribonuclease PH
MDIGAMAAAIHSASTALVKPCSVPMRGVICAAAVGRLEVGSEVVLLANPDEEEAGVGCG